MFSFLLLVSLAVISTNIRAKAEDAYRTKWGKTLGTRKYFTEEYTTKLEEKLGKNNFCISFACPKQNTSFQGISRELL